MGSLPKPDISTHYLTSGPDFTILSVNLNPTVYNSLRNTSKEAGTPGEKAIEREVYMDLKIKDLVELLQVSEKTIYRWLKENKIPAYRINHQYRFSRAEINEWLLQNRIAVSDRMLDLKLTKLPVNLAEMIGRGGVMYGVRGATPREVIADAVGRLSLPAGADRDTVLRLLLDREDLMPTAIGGGIAIPHPRNPLVTEAFQTEVSVCLLERPVDFRALDGLPVHTLFIVLAINSKRHLEILSRISYFCRDAAFRGLLKDKRPAADIIGFLREKESALSRKAEIP
jgi:PTS system nitrogen regulatory IIA component